MKILITGGAGYLGAHVQKHLRERGFDCLVYDDFSTGNKSLLGDCPWVEGDITDPAQMQSVTGSYRPDAVVHLAALATLGECERDPARCEQTNVEGTLNVLEAMRIHRVRHIVFSSSCAVYAPPEVGQRLKEDHTLLPSNSYGHSKLRCERLLQEYSQTHGIRSIALRIFNIAGAAADGTMGECHHPETHLLPLAIEALMGKRSHLDVYGNDYPTEDGTAVRDYVHVCDVAKACENALLYLQRGGETGQVNLGSGMPVSVAQLLSAVSAIAGKPMPIVYKPRRAGDVPWLLGDGAKAKNLLDWQPEHSDIETIVRTAWQWHQHG